MINSKDEAYNLIQKNPNWNGGVDYDLKLQFVKETEIDYIFSAFYYSIFGRAKLFVQLCVNKESGDITNLTE